VSYATSFSILDRLSVVIEVALQSIACASLKPQAKSFRVATIQAFLKMVAAASPNDHRSRETRKRIREYVILKTPKNGREAGR
jgi:hypothetical protein